MTRILLPIIIAIATCGSALADEKPVSYRVVTTANQFNPTDNTYNFDVRFLANPCPDVNYNIGFSVTGVKDLDEARDRF